MMLVFIRLLLLAHLKNSYRKSLSYPLSGYSRSTDGFAAAECDWRIAKVPVLCGYSETVDHKKNSKTCAQLEILVLMPACFRAGKLSVLQIVIMALLSAWVALGIVLLSKLS